MTPPGCDRVDPFELPEWLGTDEVTWSAQCALGKGSVRGLLRSDSGSGELACDLLAADVACPAPCVDETTRTRVHQAWRDGQIDIVTREGRLTLGVPGTSQDADLVLEAIGRFAQAVGAGPEHYGVRLRAGH